MVEAPGATAAVRGAVARGCSGSCSAGVVIVGGVVGCDDSAGSGWAGELVVGRWSALRLDCARVADPAERVEAVGWGRAGDAAMAAAAVVVCATAGGRFAVAVGFNDFFLRAALARGAVTVVVVVTAAGGTVGAAASGEPATRRWRLRSLSTDSGEGARTASPS